MGFRDPAPLPQDGDAKTTLHIIDIQVFSGINLSREKWRLTTDAKKLTPFTSGCHVTSIFIHQPF